MPFDALGRIFFAASSDQFRIPDAIPDGFQAQRIIYREFDTMTRPTRHYYVDVDKSTQCSPDFDIDEFVSNIALYGYTRNDLDVNEEKPLDIPVWFDSYIILELQKDSRVTFNDPNEGITLASRSQAPPNNIYGALKYVDQSGVIHPAPIPNCRIAFFAARFQEGEYDDPYTQGLNFNLQTMDGTITAIDPDVRHPGLGTP